VRKGIDARRKALRRLGKTCVCHAVHGTEDGNDVGSLEIVVNRRGHEIEELWRHFRILDVQAKGVGDAFDRERNRDASTPDGDDEERPRLAERFIGSN
jgi:hypothetical protein